MEKEKNGSLSERIKIAGEDARDNDRRKSKRRARESSDDAEEVERKGEKRVKTKAKWRRRYNSDSSSSYSDSDSRSDGSSESESASSSTDSEEERRRRKKRKERKRREEEKERERKRRREKERKKKRKEKEEKKNKKKKDKGSKGAVTNSWGKYGIIRETDMWNKRPEFTAWLMEIKQVNLEHLPNWEEKQMFKQFMEDHNTATFPSKKYYDLDAYYRHQIEKDLKRGSKKVVKEEMTVFNDEEQRRIEMMKVREKQKEQEVEALKRSMQGGMAQAMKEQAQLKEEMAYQYKIGNFEAAAAIQRRLDPDVPM